MSLQTILLLPDSIEAALDKSKKQDKYDYASTGRDDEQDLFPKTSKSSEISMWKHRLVQYPCHVTVKQGRK